MINTVEKTIPNCLKEATQKAYENIKALIQKIFSLLKIQSKEENLKVEFEKSFVDFCFFFSIYNGNCSSYIVFKYIGIVVPIIILFFLICAQGLLELY